MANWSSVGSNEMNNRAMVNPATGVDAGAVVALADREGLRDHVLFATSGTGGAPKWAALSREALERSARSVNEVLGASSEDVWLRVLPEFHVAGYAISLRARAAGARVWTSEGPWDARRFVRRAKGATLCSLVPTQVHDLVSAGLRPPASLRTVLVGGAAMSGRTRAAADALGWPLRATYGMTEAGSTVAIEGDGGALELLRIWRARVRAGVEIEIAGGALFTGYLGAPPAGDWFATGDRGAVEGRRLRVDGRCDSIVKVLGERVDLQALEGILPAGHAIAALPDERAGSRLVLVSTGEAAGVLEEFNRGVAGFERLSGVVRIERIPRGALGKVRRQALVDQVLEKINEA